MIIKKIEITRGKKLYLNGSYVQHLTRFIVRKDGFEAAYWKGEEDSIKSILDIKGKSLEVSVVNEDENKILYRSKEAITTVEIIYDKDSGVMIRIGSGKCDLTRSIDKGLLDVLFDIRRDIDKLLKK